MGALNCPGFLLDLCDPLLQETVLSGPGEHSGGFCRRQVGTGRGPQVSQDPGFCPATIWAPKVGILTFQSLL